MWGGYLSLLGGFTLHLTLGTLYCFGNMNTYMTSYLRTHVKGEAATLYSDAVWIPTLASAAQGFFMFFSGYLEERLGVRLTVLLGSAFMTSGVFLTYFSIQHSLAAVTLTYGFMFGFGVSLAYAPPMAVAMKWFPRKKGLVNGIIVGGFGMGAFIFNTVQTTYLNPDNLSPADSGYFSAAQGEVLERVPSVFLLLGSIYALMQLLAVCLIFVPSEDLVAGSMPLVAAHQEEEEEEVIYQDIRDLSPTPPLSYMEDRDQKENVEPRMIVKTKEFWILFVTFFLNLQAVGYINTMYKVFGQQFIQDDHFLAVVGAFAAVFNCGGRVFWGHLCDRYGYRASMLCVTSAISVLYATFYFTEFGRKVLFAVWVWAIFFSFCGNFVLLPTATAQCFGTRHSSKNYGLVMIGSAVASFVIALLTSTLQPVLGFLGMFLIIALFSLGSSCLTLWFPPCPSPRKILEKLDTSLPTDL